MPRTSFPARSGLVHFHDLAARQTPTRSSNQPTRPSPSFPMERRCHGILVALVLVLCTWGPSSTVVGAQEIQTIRFKEPSLQEYAVETGSPARPQGLRAGDDWLPAWRTTGGRRMEVRFGRRIMVQMADGAVDALSGLIAGRPLQVARRVTDTLVVLEAPDAPTAVREAAWFANQPGVVAARPVMQRKGRTTTAFSKAPNDTYFPRQWHLENRNPETGQSMGIDLAVRGAWPVTRGKGVTVAVADDGIDLNHPDLAGRAINALHFNFNTREANGFHPNVFHEHGTAVAGLAVGEQGNRRGITGVAPEANLASWVVFNADNFIAGDESLMDMFQYKLEEVAVQNHSWGIAFLGQLAPTLLEYHGINTAYTLGRKGLGVVIVRAGGNGRLDEQNVNDDGYPSDPRVIAVAAARSDGRATSYSSPGSPILVAAPSGDAGDGYPMLFTTDRLGRLGYNKNESILDDLGDYAFESTGFSGTSGASPLVAGVCALILSANPKLHVRDVQQILALSAHHRDLADPGITTNGAGLRFSHNVGYGIPDAGQAVALASTWTPRPPQVRVSLTNNQPTAVPDAGLRVKLAGRNVPAPLVSIVASPALGLHPDNPTRALPIVDVGRASAQLRTNLTGKAALIQRGDSLFSTKLAFAALAGAEFAVVYNNTGQQARMVMAGTDYAPIPAVFIGQFDGEDLASFLGQRTNPTAQLVAEGAALTFSVTNRLACEHVSVRILSDHPSRGDLRISLVSPSGSRSVLQRVSSDREQPLLDWNYHSTLHFFEPSAGTWRVEIVDEETERSGNILQAVLELRGVAIEDSDADGLDDAWENRWFRGLAQNAVSDPDRDGQSNGMEQVLGSDPTNRSPLFAASGSFWTPDLLRLSWPSTPGARYQVLSARGLTSPFGLITNLSGRLPETEWFVPKPTGGDVYWRIRELPSN